MNRQRYDCFCVEDNRITDLIHNFNRTHSIIDKRFSCWHYVLKYYCKHPQGLETTSFCEPGVADSYAEVWS